MYLLSQQSVSAWPDLSADDYHGSSVHTVLYLGALLFPDHWLLLQALPQSFQDHPSLLPVQQEHCLQLPAHRATLLHLSWMLHTLPHFQSLLLHQQPGHSRLSMLATELLFPSLIHVVTIKQIYMQGCRKLHNASKVT